MLDKQTGTGQAPHDLEARADIVVTADGRMLKNRQGPRSVGVLVISSEGYAFNPNRADR